LTAPLLGYYLSVTAASLVLSDIVANTPDLLAIVGDAVAELPRRRRLDVQRPAGSWGLDRIDQAALPLDNSYSYLNGGAGARVYSVGSGIVAYSGRTVFGIDTAIVTNGGVDCHGSGTEVRCV
jgi:hypothetical protein